MDFLINLMSTMYLYRYQVQVLVKTISRQWWVGAYEMAGGRQSVPGFRFSLAN